MEEIRKEIDVGDWHSNLPHDEWTPLTVPGSRASARYKVDLIDSFDLIGDLLCLLSGKCSMRRWLLMRSSTLSVEAVTADTYLMSRLVYFSVSFIFFFNGSVLICSICQVFDLRSLTWDSFKLITGDGDGSLGEAFPAISDHRMVSPLHAGDFFIHTKSL